MPDFGTYGRYLDALGVRIAVVEAQLNAGAALHPVRSAEVASRMQELFSIEELDELAFGLGIKPEEIRGETIVTRPFHLVEHCHRHGLAVKLVELLREKRPFVDW